MNSCCPICGFKRIIKRIKDGKLYCPMCGWLED